MTPERFREEEELPPDDELVDDRRAARLDAAGDRQDRRVPVLAADFLSRP